MEMTKNCCWTHKVRRQFQISFTRWFKNDRVYFNFFFLIRHLIILRHLANLLVKLHTAHQKLNICTNKWMNEKTKTDCIAFALQTCIIDEWFRISGCSFGCIGHQNDCRCRWRYGWWWCNRNGSMIVIIDMNICCCGFMFKR